MSCAFRSILSQPQAPLDEYTLTPRHRFTRIRSISEGIRFAVSAPLDEYTLTPRHRFTRIRSISEGIRFTASKTYNFTCVFGTFSEYTFVLALLVVSIHSIRFAHRCVYAISQKVYVLRCRSHTLYMRFWARFLSILLIRIANCSVYVLAPKVYVFQSSHTFSLPA